MQVCWEEQLRSWDATLRDALDDLFYSSDLDDIPFRERESFFIQRRFFSGCG